MLRGSGGDYATLNKENKTMLKLLQCVPFDLFAALLNRLCGRLEVSVPPLRFRDVTADAAGDEPRHTTASPLRASSPSLPRKSRPCGGFVQTLTLTRSHAAATLHVVLIPRV